MSQSHTFEYKYKGQTFTLSYPHHSYIHLYEDVYGRSALYDIFYEFVGTDFEHIDDLTTSKSFTSFIRGFLIGKLRGSK